MAKNTPLGWFRTLLGGEAPDAATTPPPGDAALRRLHARAARGDAYAARRLGEGYLRGAGVPRSVPEAARWIRQAAEGGDARARLMLAALHLGGVGHAAPGTLFNQPERAPDPEAALREARLAAEAGSVEAMALLGWLLATGQGAAPDHAAAARWYGEAAAAGHAPARFGLGLIRLHGTDGVVDKPLACRLIGEAAEAGLPHALYVLGTLHEAAVPPLPFDEAKALALYRRAAEAGIRPAAARLGLALLRGWGCEPGAVEGERWLRRAALAGDAEAAALVGDLQLRPPGGAPPNQAEAARWFRLAAEHGHAQAMHVLAALHGRETSPEGADEARLWLDRAAGAGDGAAAADLARLGSAAGNGTAEARAAADRLEAQAEAGSALSAFNYAVCLNLGVGRAPDPEAALRGMRRAAEAGQVNARFWLGRLLLERGHAPDEAWGHIEAAAEAGMEEARAALRARA